MKAFRRPNGGSVIKKSTNSREDVHAAVRPRECFNCRCRWAVSRPEYIEELRAKLNNLFFHKHVLQLRYYKYEQILHTLQREKYSAEKLGHAFTKSGELDKVSGLFESASVKLAEVLTGIKNVIYTMNRCEDLLHKRKDFSNNTQLVLSGTLEDVRLALEKVDSELLQLSGICEDAELYPDLDVGNAVIRRSQILDQLLMRQFDRPLFLHLDEKTQLKLGNCLLRELASTVSETDPIAAMKTVTSSIDRGQALSIQMRQAISRSLSERYSEFKGVSRVRHTQSGSDLSIIDSSTSNQSPLASPAFSPV